jgi:acyl-CoA thioesterase-1
MTARTSRWCLWLVCLLSAACGGKQDANNTAGATPAGKPAAPAVLASDDTPQRPRIVALGDSLTAGFGLVESQSYPTLLQKKIDADGYQFEVINAGVSGDTSAGGLRRLDWALEGDVKVLILALGANDGLRGLSIAEMKENLSKIIERARERNVFVILAGMEAPPNYGPEYAVSFRNAYRDIALKYRVKFIPFLLDKVAGDPALNQADGIHPNEQGAEILANTVWAVLQPVIDQMSSTQ